MIDYISNNYKLILILIGATILYGVIWYFFIIVRCPNCKSTDIHHDGHKEIDRFLSTKEVTEKLASGKTKTRHVQCTYVKNEYYYTCNACGYKFTEVKKEELK